MKKINKYILLAASLACWGCGDFLEETSLTLLRPSTIDDLEQILVGEGYRSNTILYYDEFYQADNVEFYKRSDFYMVIPDNLLNMYLWRPDMYTKNTYEGAAEVRWSVPYRRILGCNVVLDYLDEMEGFADKREYLRGEALGLRGWIYFQLVNRFCTAYNQCDDPATEPGVPLKLESSVGVEYLSRSTLKEVYDRIEADLLESNRLLREYDEQRPGNWRVGHLAVKAMLSRLYLYEEKWDEAIAWADSVLAVNHYLADFKAIASGDALYDTEECIWGNSCTLENNPSYTRISDSYLTAYSITRDSLNNAAARIPDLRALLMKNGMMLFSRYAREGIRTAELYLNRAEAYIHKFLDGGDDSDKEAALETLRELRKHRLNTEYAGEEEELPVPEGEEEGKNLLEFCIDERWRELGGEINHRWCDVRRYGHTLTHTWEENDLSATQDMSRYAQPIPEVVFDQNPAL